ncbi:hypothetical protein N9Y42_03500 [Mariniblastus sp.]|nr:hypothetical protein [Mariniblastus sp.]
MLNFEIKKSTRKCAETGRDFEPGEVFFSALIENEDGTTSREDYSADAWDETPEHCIGWWKSQVPETDKGKIFWAPRKVMLAYFEHVLTQPASQDIAFVTALLLIQKKYLVMVDDGEANTMTVRNRTNKESYSVPIVELEGPRLADIQALLSEQLFMDEPIDDDLEDTDE